MPFFGKKKITNFEVMEADIRPSVTSPQQYVSAMESRSALILGVLVASLVFLGISILSLMFVPGKVRGVLYVSDGTPFGCEVQQMKISGG